MNFLVCGVLLLCLAVGLRRVLHPGPGSTWGPFLLGVSGLGFTGAGVFATDPGLGYPSASSTGTLHWSLHLLASNVSILSVVVACFVLGRVVGLAESSQHLWDRRPGVSAARRGCPPAAARA